jgi:[acyl-carrier-protein] S-malonyltransferase
MAGSIMSTEHRRALLFSGQGAQRVGMGLDLFEKSPAARALYEKADAALGWSLSEVSFRGPEAKLTETRVCQPALYVHGLAILAAYQEIHGKPLRLDAAAGLSLGEYTAHAAAGTFSFETGLHLVAERGRLMQEACESTSGTMITLLGATSEQAREIAAACNVDVANLNCPGQIVLSGAKDAMAGVDAAAKERGVRKVIPLKVAGAYHSRLMASAAKGLAPYLAQAGISPPRVPVVANFSAESVPTPEQIRPALKAQVCGSVCWEDSIRKLLVMGISHFVECGPGGVIAGLIKRISPQAHCLSLETYDDLVKHADALN